jgi:fluoroacetyl-CoA thioesterase
VSGNAQVGQSHEVEVVVTEELTAPRFVRGTPPAFATPALVALIERAGAEFMAPYLGTGQSSVGTWVDVRHLAPTPVGMKVRCRVTLEEMEGRRCRFSVLAWDDEEKIGEATHERHIIDRAKFDSKLEEKGLRKK